MTTTYYKDSSTTVLHADCLEALRELPDNSVHAVVTDPPYGIGFMGKEWDSGKSFVERKPARGNTFDHVGGNHNPTDSADSARTRRVEAVKFGAWCKQWMDECYRVLMPGGHVLAAGGTRTWHRLACAAEDAGFEIRDSIAWLYGSGFPKSLNVAKAIESGTGRPEDIRRLSMGDGYVPSGRGRVNYDHGGGSAMNGRVGDVDLSPEAEEWQGWGTALKPAFEPVVMARKPLDGTVAANVLAWGAGALNIDGCRVGDGGQLKWASPRGMGSPDSFADDAWTQEQGRPYAEATESPVGRWPANVVLDESQAEVLDEQTGVLTSGKMKPTHTTAGVDGRASCYGADAAGGFTTMETYGDSGGASRFFFVAKGEEHDEDSCPDCEWEREHGYGVTLPPDHLDARFRYVAKANASERVRVNGVAHPTVKPLDLMRWLVRLVTPPGGTVLEPFAGSGTTVEACILEGFHCIAIERDGTYLPLIRQRILRSRDPFQSGEVIDVDHETAPTDGQHDFLSLVHEQEN